MILGVGIDIIEVQRIQNAHQRHGDRFLQRLLRGGEVEYCFSHGNPGPHLAARFAAKEAVSKAFGTGIGAQLGWLDMEVHHEESGQPHLVFHGKGRDLLGRHGARQIHLSLSHTLVYACAVAVLEGDGKPFPYIGPRTEDA